MTRLDRLGAETTKARPEFDSDEISELCDHAQALADAMHDEEDAWSALIYVVPTRQEHEDRYQAARRARRAALAAFDEWNEDQ